MQLFSSLLFAQLPSFIANLTAPTATSSASVTAPAMATHTFSLPPLPYEYNALEPHISEQIMKLHHDKHHQAYVTNLNAATLAHIEALKNNDIKAEIVLQSVIKFNGGGHINHSLFWPSLCPSSSPCSSPSSAPTFAAAIESQFGSLEKFKEVFNKLLMGIQGSGWGWIVKRNGRIEMEVTKDQDPVTNGEVIMGVDMWEHAYYLQYWNNKVAYIQGVWEVMNWETAEKRWGGEKIGDPRL
ncbi:Manganese/iron superoxide dismutase [Pyronema omphalodes]|nr:Manganese/iron superoxide dismutase [Pyronema omphalodes]